MAQVDVGTTLVSPIRRDGTPHTRCAVEDGVALMRARRRKERTYPELTGAHGRARLVVLASEVGWQMVFRDGSGGGARFWRAPVSGVSHCLCWKGVPLQGHDGPTPTTDVVIGNSRYAGLA